MPRDKAEDDFWELVEDAIAENERAAAKVDRSEGAECALSTPAAPHSKLPSDTSEPCGTLDGPSARWIPSACAESESADGGSTAGLAWLRGLLAGAKSTDERIHRLVSIAATSPSSSNGGCTAFEHEPNHCRFGIDDDNTPSVLDEADKAMLMEEVGGMARSDELLNVAEWSDLDLEMVLDSGCCAHILDAAHEGTRVPSAGIGRQSARERIHRWQRRADCERG